MYKRDFGPPRGTRSNIPSGNPFEKLLNTSEQKFLAKYKYLQLLVLQYIELSYLHSLYFQSTLSVKSTPKPSPKLQRKESQKSQRSWLGVFRNREDNKSLVDSQSDSEGDLDEPNNKKPVNNNRRHSTNNYRFVLIAMCIIAEIILFTFLSLVSELIFFTIIHFKVIRFLSPLVLLAW